jgi:hypothetical protein
MPNPIRLTVANIALYCVNVGHVANDSTRSACRDVEVTCFCPPRIRSGRFASVLEEWP